MQTRKPMPSTARMVFKGMIFEVWQWEQELYDGTTMTFERLRRPHTAVIIPVVGDKILLVDEEQPDSAPFSSAPSGRIESGEEPLAGAQRELAEETGYVSDDWELLTEVNPVGKMEWTIFVFVARNCRKERDQSLDAGEKISPRFVSFDDFLLCSENQNFRSDEIVDMLLRARIDKEKCSALKRHLGILS